MSYFISKPNIIDPIFDLNSIEDVGTAAISISPDRTRMLRGKWDGSVSVWELSYNPFQIKLVTNLEGHGNAVVACAYSPDGTKIIAGGRGGNLILWDSRTYQKIIQGQPGLWNYELIFLDTNRILVRNHRQVLIFNAHNLQLIHTICVKHRRSADASDAEIYICAPSFNGKRIAISADQSHFPVYDGSTYSELGSFGGKYRIDMFEILKGAYSPTNDYFLMGGTNGKLYLFNTGDPHTHAPASEQGQPLMTLCLEFVPTALLGHNQNITALAWSSDGTDFAAGDADGNLMIWNAGWGVHIPIFQRMVHVQVNHKDDDKKGVAVSAKRICLPKILTCWFVGDPSCVIMVTEDGKLYKTSTIDIKCTFKDKASARDRIVGEWSMQYALSYVDYPRRSRYDINYQSTVKRFTDLHRAAQNKHLNFCAKLCYLGADKTLVDWEGRTAFSYLSDREIEIVTSLQRTLSHRIDYLLSPPSKALSSRLTFRNHPPDPNFEKMIDELWGSPYLQPLLRIARIAILGLHDLGTPALLDSGYDSDTNDQLPMRDSQKLSIVIDPHIPTVDSICHRVSDAFGVYTWSNTLFLGGARTMEQIKGTFIHELTHFVAHEVYKNNCEPFCEGDVIRFDKIAKAVKIFGGHPILAGAFSDFYNRHDKNRIELIARLPQLMATIGHMKWPDYLSTAGSEIRSLNQYYQEHFLSTVKKHAENLELRALGGWPIEFFKPKPK